MALGTDDKEFIQMLIQGSNAKNQANYDILNSKVDGVNSRLDKINGRINEHDKTIYASIQERKIQDQKNKDELERIETIIKTNETNHPLICQQVPRIQKLETENITKKEIKKFMISTILLTSTIITIIFTIGKIFFGL